MASFEWQMRDVIFWLMKTMRIVITRRLCGTCRMTNAQYGCQAHVQRVTNAKEITFVLHEYAVNVLTGNDWIYLEYPNNVLTYWYKLSLSQM